MTEPVSRLDMIRALVAFARANIMATSEDGEYILTLALNHYYDDMSYNELDLRYTALVNSRFWESVEA